MNKKSVISIRLTNQQKEVISQRAEKCGLNVSEYLRESAANGGVIKSNNRDFMRLLGEVNRISNYINQIAQKIYYSSHYNNSEKESILNVLKNIDLDLHKIIEMSKKRTKKKNLENREAQSFNIQTMPIKQTYSLLDSIIRDCQEKTQNRKQ